PRRDNYPWDDPKAAEEQIRWEFRHLARATACLFWFPPQTLCPIALYELGRWSAGERPMFVGVHPDYERRLDVEIQLSLARPEVRVAKTMEELAAQVIQWFNGAERGSGREGEAPAEPRPARSAGASPSRSHSALRTRKPALL